MIKDDPTVRMIQQWAVVCYPPIIFRPKENVQRR
jgi:hypothetical protein